MSEPLSSVEIEDVLSSIRRLVSEDLRPMQRAAMGQPMTAPKQALILTPALRVVSDAPPVREVPVQEVAPLIDAGAAATDLDWQTETGDAAPEPGPEADRVWYGDTAEDARFAEAEADPVEALVADVVEAAPEADPETDILQPEGPEAELTVAPEVVEDDSPVPQEGWAQAGVEEAAYHGEVLTETAAEPAEAGWVDQAEAEVIAGLEQAEPVEPALNLMDDTPDLTFDEEVLRDLVRDLIREELQGHLGERITRNIRKLVRAEIARALAAAELN